MSLMGTVRRVRTVMVTARVLTVGMIVAARTVMIALLIAPFAMGDSALAVRVMMIASR